MGAWGMSMDYGHGYGYGYGHGPLFRIEQCHCSFARTLSRVLRTLELSVTILASWLLLFAPGIIFHMEFKKEKGKIPGFRPLGEN